jgi:hypothetical protein
MKATEINEFKSKVKSALYEWGENKIDALFKGRTNTKALFKRGLSNVLDRYDEKINSYVDYLALFIGDSDGNIDSESLIDVAVGIFEEMESTELDLGFCLVHTGKGAIVIDLPRNMMMDLLVGNLGSLRFTAEDIKEFKNYLS